MPAEQPKKRETEELIIEAKRFFETYKKEIGKSVREDKKVVFVDFDDLSSFSHELSEEILASPQEILRILETALDEIGLIKNARVRLKNIPETQGLKIGHIRSRHLNKLISIEGIVRQASDVRPQVVNAKFECPSCGTIISVLQIEKKFREPTRCSCGRRGQFNLISKEMVDAQRLVIEESPESLSGGEQPRRMSIFLQEDLVEPKMEEKTTPGSRVRVIGTLQEIPVPLQTGSISTRFDLAIESNNIIPLEENYEEVDISEEDERQINELAEDPKVFEKLAASIAPSIWGYEEIKKALVLQMFGGVRKKGKDGSIKRGDMHVFLIGDPGVAKSVTLKFISEMAPKGRYIVGKAASGAGITATVVKDEFLKGWSLEAGAMVLANKGIVCIDEIEKMDPNDRSAMHEAMEQQCYHKDTIIALADGSERKIGDLVEEMFKKNKDRIINGKDCFILPTNEIEVLTTDFKNIFKTKASRISKHKAFEKFIKVKFSNGRSITVTPEHPVFIIKNGEIITERADSVKIGEAVPIPLIMPIEGERQTFEGNIENKRAKQHITIPEKNCKEIFKIIGYFIAEGSREINRKKLIGINFTNKDQRLLNDFENLMKKVFGLSPYKQIRIDEHGERACYRYTSRELAEFLKKNMPEMLKTSGEKQIPQILMKGQKENIAAMISTMFEGDGYVALKERTIRIGYSTKSRRLAEQVQDLLLRFGIRSNLNENGEYFKVLITSYDNLEKFSRQIGFITPEKNFVINKYLTEKTIKRAVKNIIPQSFNEKIIKIIEDEGIKKVRNYSVYDIIYDHSKREDKFAFSRNFLIELKKLVKKQENLELLENLTSDIGFEKISGIEVISNEDENWVYDVTIEPNHAFVSQAAILHNTVTISKANVQATLHAETSVLAAGNPKLGRFEPFQSIAQQIDLPPALINRFDVIFILRDMPDKFKDDAIANHVLTQYQKNDMLIPIDRKLFRKYVAYAKQKIHPILTDEAVKEIREFYVKMRNAPVSSDLMMKPIPISARQLEALVRLAEAHAKMRMSKKVTKEDSKIAIDIIKYYLMQVGFDQETKTFDIDKIAIGVSTSQRSKVILLRETISKLEERLGKFIPIEELEKELEGKLKKDEIDDSIQKLIASGDVFTPRKGFVQRI